MSKLTPFKTSYLSTHCFIRTGKKDVNQGDKSGIYPFFTCSKNYTYSNSFSFDTEALLVAGNGEVGNVQYFCGKFEAYQRTYVIDKFDLNVRYVYHFLRHHLKDRLSRTHAGSVIQFIKLSDLTKFELSYPECGVEQAKLAQILDTLDTAIHETEAVIAKLKAVKQGLLHDLLTRGIDANGELRPPQAEAPHLYKKSTLGWIPKEWDVRPLSDYTSSEITYGIVQAGPHVPTGVPYIRTGDMSGDCLIREGMLCTSRRIASNYARSEVRTGDIVMAIRATVGKVLPVPSDLNGANLTQGTAKISPNEHTDGNFLLWAIRHSRAQQAIQLEIKGTTFAEITLGALRQVPVAAPVEINEQREIGQRLTAIDQQLQSEQQYLAKAFAEKSGLMDDLLTGRVRVTLLLEGTIP
ncbi:restriction endonuclease subunit S [Methylomonas sp. DH-1]|uniref:restriction endonuclease subunit S n=1 Tax=Methylomonas sp. (strain DH-1) TaxID=1727196 RepID=UPI0007C9D89D|nr:restriction endonuclease subunit S [Methylomonas sp. DH-1]ANE53738.1 hypothetical protein AYM39_00125 [Methylomonas sp. DH-1]